MVRATIVMGVGLVFLVACKKDDPVREFASSREYDLLAQALHIPETPFPYDAYDIPAELKDNVLTLQDNMPDSNLTTPWGATLGRVLFYDPILSRNQTVACASCHQQEFGFSDPDRLSIGFEGGQTGRHSMGLLNARYYASGRFFWDERAETLEDQVLQPIQDEVEMGMTLPEVISRLQETYHYPVLFREAFGDDEITVGRMAKALAQFVRSIVSYQSRFDENLALANFDKDVEFPGFTESENLGKDIFFNHAQIPCASCHFTNAMIADNPRNNGVMDGDSGAYEHNPQQHLIGAFKSPSLRNVAIRPPYMHNGAFPNLMSVIEHYDVGLANLENTDDLDPHLKGINDAPRQMNLTEVERQALLDFLHTLTDYEVLTKEAYSNPFRELSGKQTSSP